MRKVAFLGITLIIAGMQMARADAGSYKEYCAAAAEAGARLIIGKGKGAGLLVGALGAPDVAFLTPAWALAALQSGQHVAEANAALTKICGFMAAKGEKAGLLPWSAGLPPSMEATEMAAPVLAACLLWAPDALSTEAKTKLSTALELIAKRLHKSKPEDIDLRTLMLAAACVATGRATGDNGLMRKGDGLLAGWLKSVRDHGLVDAHGPRVEAARACALQWLVEFCQPRPKELSQAYALVWADLLQRLVGPQHLLAGPQLFSSREDAATAQGPLRDILALADGQQVAPVLAHLYYALPFRQPPPKPLDSGAEGVLRYTWSDAPLIEEQVTIAPGFARGVMTAPLNSSSVPLHIIWREQKPVVTYATVSGLCHVASVAAGGLSLHNFDFDAVGWGDRKQVWVDLHIGPQDLIKDVRLIGQKWPGQPVAVDVGMPVEVSFGHHFVGFVPCWAGPAEAKRLMLRVNPGVLQWVQSDGRNELVLRLYARQASYALRRPENDFVVGVLVAAASAQQTTFEAFCRSLRFIRQRHYSQQRKWRVPEKDQGHPILDRWKPKPKRAYAVERALDYTLELRVGGKTWLITEDLYREQVSKRVAAGQPVEPATLQFDTPWLKLPRKWKRIELSKALEVILHLPSSSG